MRIGIDVDGVVADVLTPWFARCNDELYAHGHPANWSPEDTARWDFWNHIGLPEERVWELFTPDIYDDVKPFPGALEAVNAIRATGHEIVYITSCRGSEEWAAKLEWLNTHGFRAAYDGAVGVGDWAMYRSKAQVATERRVEWLVDDNVKNVEAWPGYALLQTRSHNARLNTTRKRIKALSDVAKMLQFCGTTNGEMVQTGNGGWVHADILSIDQPDGFADTTLIDIPTAQEDYEFIASLQSSLPTDWQERKDTPVMTGCLDYFSAAIAEVARVSKAGNKQHNLGPLHWKRALSADHADSAIRHLMERGVIDTDGIRHSAKAAWRALALLQEELEAAGAPLSRASKVA